MLVVTAPNEIYTIENQKNLKVFLAGGITNCPNWQKELIDEMTVEQWEGLTLYNPRRENFPINDPKASETQIAWEFAKLRDCDMVIFWFSEGSLNPIVLYELGMWGNSRPGRNILVGVHPKYERKQDVVIQTALATSGSMTAIIPTPVIEGFDEFKLAFKSKIRARGVESRIKKLARGS